MKRTASCSCGALTATIVGDPLRVSVCHCFACQRRTGSAFGAQARFLKTNVVLNGPSTLYVRVADSGNQVSYRFCPSCGATVVYEIEALPDAIAVPLGALIEGDLPVPTVSVYEARMQPWLSLREPIEHLD